MKQPYLEAGKIVNTFGVRGEVKLQPWCDSAEFLLPFRTLYVDSVPRRVLSARVHKDMLIVRFEGVEDVNAARAAHPEALFLVHPECHPRVTALADFVGSTTEIMDHAMKSENAEFIIGTENSIVQHLQFEVMIE